MTNRKRNVDVLLNDFFPDTFVMTTRLLKEQSHEISQETDSLFEMWTSPCLGGAAFYRQAHLRPFADQLSHRNENVGQNVKIFRKNGHFIICRRNVTAKLDKNMRTKWNRP